MHTTVQTHYDLQCLTMRLSGYMNAPTEPAFIDLKHLMEYLMHHPHEPIMYSRKKVHITEEISHQCYFKSGDSEIIKIRNTPTSFTHILMQIAQRDISDRRSVTSTVHIFNGTLIYWCARKQFETSRSSSNAETRAM